MLDGTNKLLHIFTESKHFQWTKGVPKLVCARIVITDAWCRAVCTDVWPERKDGTLSWQVNSSNNIVGA